MNSAAPAGSPAPGADAPVPHIPASRSRLSVMHTRPASPGPRSRRATSELVKDADAEGEDDPDDPSGDPEDKTLYCTCQSLSYGKMIGCENDACPYQWVSARPWFAALLYDCLTATDARSST
jgi:chromatin modification-related protein YNG2